MRGLQAEINNNNNQISPNLLQAEAINLFKMSSFN